MRGGRWSPRTVLLCFNFLGRLLREQQKLAAAFFRIAQAPEDQLIEDGLQFAALRKPVDDLERIALMRRARDDPQILKLPQIFRQDLFVVESI